LPTQRVWRNVAKHASLPVITLYPISMIKALGGLVLVELVFNWPGIGFTLIEAVFNRDFPILQFVFVILAVYIVLANFLVDMLYSRIDPRVSLD
jgi:peptide/nickel transport system permease protein